MVNEKPNVKPMSKFSATETANILGINRKTLYRHTKLGFIHCTIQKCNGRPRYSGSEIQRYWGAEYK